MIHILGVLGLTALFLALAATPVCRSIFLRLKLVDHPDSHRKFHKKPIPRVGGIAVIFAYAGALALLLLFSDQRAAIFAQHHDILWQLLPATIIVFLTGLVDDIVGLKPWQKILGQLAGAAWACATGVRILGVGALATDHAPWWSLPLTILWLLACTNAVNLIDGVDGLAAGVGLCATLTALLAAVLQGNMGLAVATVPLAGALLGFLRYNFNPASIFLGDCGSLVIGFLLGCFSVIWSQKSATLLGMVAPMMAMALPILDVALAIARRFLNNQPIFGADRGHIHHRLMDHGLKPRDVALVLYGVCGVAAVFSLLQSMLYNRLGGLIVVGFCAAAWFGIQRLGYVEFSVVHRMLRRGIFRQLLQEQIHLRRLEGALQKAGTPEECWHVIEKTCRDLGFRHVQWKTGESHFESTFVRKPAGQITRLRVDLSGTDFLRLDQEASGNQSFVALPLMNTIQTALQHKAKAQAAAAGTNHSLFQWDVNMYSSKEGETGEHPRWRKDTVKNGHPDHPVREAV